MTGFNTFITSKDEVCENLEFRVGRVRMDYLPMSLGLNHK